MRFIFTCNDSDSYFREDESDCRIMYYFGQQGLPLETEIIPEKAQNAIDSCGLYTIPLVPHSSSFQLLHSYLKKGWQRLCAA